MTKTNQTPNQTTQLPPTSSPTSFRHAYSPQHRVSITFPTKGRTKQSFKDECDINNIMGRYSRTGILESQNRRMPQYGDIENIDFQGAMETVASAREMFAALPSNIRDRFRNDPTELLGFLQDPENKAEALSLGLLRDATEVQATPLATPASASPAAPAAASAASAAVAP
ncbi:MAG: internal scaffolding protein [Microvirus sp.]|nr:MAG: internal scaffolding protein [Microvirus sp.]